MLEGAVARLLNQLLGKYVVDLDTENLNVGIFSGHVQLTDLKLKTEALYELNLPVQVIAGTISKIRLQIPWTSLWSQPVIVNVEDVHIIAGPIVSYGNQFDEEKNKRLLRAFKRQAIQCLNDEYELIGGPVQFREYLISSIVNNLQLNITNVHIRYEDRYSTDFPLAAGICIGSITAETTNNKWKPTKQTKHDRTSFYLIKMEAFSVYWNSKYEPIDWDLPSQYYNWRNAMSNSLKNYALNDQNFEFILKPMTVKIKTTIQKSNANNNAQNDSNKSEDDCRIAKITSDVVVQDCNLQITKLQYESIVAAHDALQRMYTAWNYLPMRPQRPILRPTPDGLRNSTNSPGTMPSIADRATVRAWWKYAYLGCLEQRIRPYYWTRIRNVRENYKNYCEIYKKILLNPKDTELKLDLQQYEDKLSVVNIVIARQHTRLLVHCTSLSEKSFWDILPSPERTLLCDKIGYGESERVKTIEHCYNLRVGNVSLTLHDSGAEIFILTLTQLIAAFQPNLSDKSFALNTKIEALIVDGISSTGDESLVTLISSQHLHNSPAYFLKFNLERTTSEKNCNYRLNGVLESLEIVYNEVTVKAFKDFVGNCNQFAFDKLVAAFKKMPYRLFASFKDKIRDKWDVNFDVRMPHLVLPENGTLQMPSNNLMVIDCGHVIINTELVQETDISENATQMELEEQLYSRLYLKCDNAQLLFCDRADNWKDARKEKDTDLHLISKFDYTAIYGTCVKTTKTLPKEKFNMNISSVKCNLSERKIGKLLKYLNSINSLTLFVLEESPIDRSVYVYSKDTICNKLSPNYLHHVQNALNATSTFVNKSRRSKQERSGSVLVYDKRKMSENNSQRENANEVWARTVDLPGLEDNVSPNNNFNVLLRFVVGEFQFVFSRSNDKNDRDYLMLRLGSFSTDVGLMSYGPAFQLNVNSILLTDKLHTTPSGQYLDLIHSPVPSTTDVVTVLYRKVAANCPDFWTHFHGVETSLVADFGTLNVMLHQEAVHTIVKYTRYINEKIKKQMSEKLLLIARLTYGCFCNLLKSSGKKLDVPVPPGSVKFSHSARLSDLNVRICDSDFDFVNVRLSGLEMDFLFKANERFVFRSFLSNLNVDHLSDVTLYPKVFSTDEDKVFEVKYVRYANTLHNPDEITSGMDETVTGGSFKFHLGQIHVVFLYKLIVQLHRFVMNLDISDLIDDIIDYMWRRVARGMETFKSNTKIHLAINIKGPVVLFPQKSSSPNLLVFDIGGLNVENFFKEYPNEYVENILLKLDGITITRGIMTLTSTLVMQEVIIEPLGCHIDVKRYVPLMQTKQSQTPAPGYATIKRPNWDIDGVMDTVQVTLGQKDLTTLLSIYTDNIGEGKLLDLFPTCNDSVTPSVAENDDETVKTLEAFFCEPKQKDVTVKFSFDGLSLLLFFDSGEMLSSPIRDLNHGLCKLDVVDVVLSFVVYTDTSLDGKLSMDMIQIEEIGPDANAYDKNILQSPMDDNKNNNCHITVNKPPIIDVTFHKNKTNDKSIDIIVGRLNLSLSVPFCEKLAMFVLECVPKDIAGEAGIINQGYVGDGLQEHERTVTNSLTVALRVNRPEFTFVVETTSNKKRYFITKTEILVDYSRHIKMLNFVVSLSGLHSLFYDYSPEPYTILKQCDVEVSKSFNEEKGTKITAVVSSVYVQICNRIVYNLNDILNDIIEHFKVPELEDGSRKNSVNQQDIFVLESQRNEFSKQKRDVVGTVRKNSRNSLEYNDLWSPCKIINYETFDERTVLETQSQEHENTGNLQVLHEIFLLQKTEIVVVMELEDVSVLLLKATLEATMYDWSSFLNCTCELTLQANYFNENLQQWEPFIDPIVVDHDEYKPWEMTVKVFQDKCIPMLSNEARTKKETKRGRKHLNTFKSNGADTVNDADVDDDDDDDEASEDDMVYLEPSNAFLTRNTRIKTSLSTFLDDTDSENEDGTMEKLAAAISDLFTGDWNESVCSESDYSSDGDDDSGDETVTIKRRHQEDALEETPSNYKKSIYILIDSKEVLNITITPSLLKVLNELFTIYSNKTLSIINSNLPAMNLINDIGPKTRVELYEKKSHESTETGQNNNEGNGADDAILLCSKTYEKQDSCTNSPTKSNYYSYDYNGGDADDKDSYTDDISKIDIEMGYDDETMSSLAFPTVTTPYLYEKINKNHLKIHVPGFQTIQTSCPKRWWQKLIKLHPIINNQLYYVIAKHTIGKRGRSVTVTSPLQISNETCFALSVLYQPSALQQLNLEPVGDVTNPFETTMRIAVLEPHEKYNVPLFIAYHSKLFIQPAYAEGHYASDNGIWWKDLSTDLDVAHNFHCEPKSKSNLEVFSLRLMLKKNVEVKNSHVHSIPNYVIYLLPPLILHNFLPYSLEVQNVYLKQQMKIEPGEQTSVYSLNLSKDQKLLIKISYANLIWSGILNLTTHLDEKIVNLTSESNKNMSINVKTDRDGSCNIYFYTPYWIINKTTLPLHIKGSSTNVIYESTSEEILLFTYKRHGKQMLNMKVYESDWSNDFGLDCLGTTGLVVCKDNVRKKRYTFLVSIRLSELCPKYTKLIFILPNFIVANNTNRNLRFMEHNEKTDLWIDLNPHSSLPFWPETSSMQMYVKFRDSKLNSQAFFISTMHHTVLRMDRGGALCVDVTGGKNESFFITFNEYRDGDAPVFIKNMCPDLFLKVQQQGQSQVTLLSPFNGLLYTWDDPTKPRQLIWNVYNNKGSGFLIDISKDSYGEEKINFHSVSPNQMSQTTSISSSDDSDTSSVNSESSAKTLNVPANAKKIRKCKIVIYWICYRNGKQKTLMFTQQQRNYNQLVKDIFMEQCDLDCLLSLAGIGVSLFTDQLRRKEYVYVSMAEVPAIWEVNVGHKWKQLTLELASWIEDKYKLNYKKCQLKDYVQIDFEKMFMIKPFFAELKRTYNPAVYAQYRKSHKHRYYNAKLQQLQIDNKNKSSTASAVVLNMLPRLPLDTYKFAIVPLLEINCLRFNWKNCDVYKNVHVNVSDFYINVDSDLIRTVANLFLERFKLNREELGACYRKDMNSIRLPMKNKKPASGIIIENVHLSQFSVQIYVSGRNPNNIRSCSITNFLHYFFPSNLSPYMPAEGLKHKITTLELTDLKAMLRNILIDVLEHVRVQFLQQYYSQVMGLQVLVNPYANQIIPSNEKLPNDGDKMANVTLFACRCLLGHLNMSSAALEQCIMDIFSNQTMENIQRIRRHGSYQKSCGLPKNITSVSKRFNPGVILGLNQIIVNNANSNIQCDGERFFKGIGKALLSLITRHPDEKSDSVQVAIEAIKRAVILGEPITIHQRLTRYYNNYLGLKPFCMYESMGQHLLETVANGRFSTDNYWSHAIVDKQGKLIVIVTLEHTIKINKCRLWGTWELEWCVDLDEIISVPKVISNELIINVRQGEINPNSAAGGKLTVSGDKETLAWLKEKIGQAIIVSMEEKSWIIQ